MAGASAGIGKETARILADWGAEVIMACRDEAKAGRVLEDIKQSTGSRKVRREEEEQVQQSSSKGGRRGGGGGKGGGGGLSVACSGLASTRGSYG